MYTTSDRATNEHPRPTAGPFTAATIGTRQLTIPVTMALPSTRVCLRSAVSLVSSSR